jgi:hypothetical protein
MRKITQKNQRFSKQNDVLYLSCDAVFLAAHRINLITQYQLRKQDLKKKFPLMREFFSLKSIHSFLF